MEELTAMFRVCNAIKSDGVRCGSPALTGGNFCWQHIGGKIPSTRAKATTSVNAKLKLAYPSDRQAIQHNLFLVAQALNDGKIDTATANTFNRLYRTCEQNLRQWEKDRPSNAKMRPLPDAAPNNDVIPSEATETGVPADRSSSVGWKRSEVEEPAPRDESSTSDNGADQPTPDSPYADLWHLPSPEFAYRVFERATQIHEAKRAAERERCEGDRSMSVGCEEAEREQPTATEAAPSALHLIP